MTTKKVSEKEAESAGTKYIVLCLGLLIGFVVGFVMLLSSIPVDNNLTEYQAEGTGVRESTSTASFDFYRLLPKKSSSPDPLPISAAQTINEIPKVVPATRVVPANAQIVNAGYQEVPANFNSAQSFFLQAGRFKLHEDAQTMRAQVLLLGLEAFIVTREEADGVTAHRVRVGPYYDQNLLTEAKKRMRRGGINYEIVRVTG